MSSVFGGKFGKIMSEGKRTVRGGRKVGYEGHVARL